MAWSLVRPLLVRVSVLNNKYFYPKRIFKVLRDDKILFQNKYCTQIPPAIEPPEDDFDTIVNKIGQDDEELQNKVRLCLLEIDVLNQDGKRVPSPTFIKKQHWEHLLTLTSRSSRNRYFAYLFEIEMKTLNRKSKQQEKAQQLIEKRENEVKNEVDLIPTEYGLQGISMFLRIYESSINKTDNLRLHQASMYGQKLIIDCSYDTHMSFKEQSNAGNQLTLLFADNRANRDPFDIHFCNVDYEKETFRKLKRNIPTHADPSFPINLHEESYLDLFPREKLVYLTPHCRKELTEYDPDALYIIGCMVDKSHAEPLSLAKAKEHNLNVAKLPLDKYLQWSGGSGKSLTINQVVKILLDMRATNDWNYALRHVPRRKLYSEDSPQKMSAFKSINKNFSYTSRSNYNSERFNKDQTNDLQQGQNNRNNSQYGQDNRNNSQYGQENRNNFQQGQHNNRNNFYQRQDRNNFQHGQDNKNNFYQRQERNNFQQRQQDNRNNFYQRQDRNNFQQGQDNENNFQQRQQDNRNNFYQRQERNNFQQGQDNENNFQQRQVNRNNFQQGQDNRNSFYKRKNQSNPEETSDNRQKPSIKSLFEDKST